MSLHTFVIDGRKRLQISQSKTEPGKVLVQVLDSARDVLASCTMDAATAGVVAQVFELEGAAAEAAQSCGCGVIGVHCLCNAKARDVLQGARRTVGPAMVQAYADTNGVPPMRALPVVDVPQVSGLCQLVDKINAEKVGA